MKIKTKLQMAFGTILAFLFLISGIGMYYIHENNNVIESIESDQKVMMLYSEMAFQTVRANAAIRGYISYRDPYMLENHYEIREELHKVINELGERGEKSEEFTEFQAQLTQWEEDIDVKILPLFNQNQLEEALVVGQPILGKGSTALVQFGKKMEKEVKEEIQASLDKVKVEGEKSLLYMGILVFISALASFTLSTIFGRRISNTIKEFVASMNEFAKGNLTTVLKLKTKDEFGQLAQTFNNMAAQLRTAMQEVGNSSEQVAATAEELSASSEEVSKATEEISQSIYNISTGLEKQNNMTKNVTNLADRVMNDMSTISANVQMVNHSARTTKELSDEGHQSIIDVKEQMRMISDKTDILTEEMKKLDTISNTIVSAVGVIKDIADQTNLLAINASIEAARSGEHGKGFAVVAAEVRKLADESNGAATEIEKIVSAITKNTDRMIEEIIGNDKLVTVGWEKVDVASKAFTNIESAIHEVQEQTNAVTEAITSIHGEFEELVKEMDSINEISSQSNGNTQNVAASSQEQNAAMEEVAAASTHLSTIANSLQDSIRAFQY